MKIKDPQITLADEARNGVKEEVRSGFLDWLFEFNVTGDDGELYALGGSILSLALEKIDLATLCMAKGTGSVNQLKNSIYKLTQFPGGCMNKFYRNPQGTLKIERREHSVFVTCGEQYKVECFDDYSWHIMVDTLDGEYKADLWHREGKMEITHGDWAFMRELDGFVPITYNIKIQTEGGIYEVNAHVGNARTWGVTFKVPDNPVAVLIFDRVEGTFTDNYGNVRTLTGGRGTMSVRQWHAYPNILPRELYSDEVLTGEKFETL